MRTTIGSIVRIDIKVVWISAWKKKLKKGSINKIEAIRTVWDRAGRDKMGLKEAKDIVEAFMEREGIL
jgi:ribosomal protein L7/L12